MSDLSYDELLEMYHETRDRLKSAVHELDQAGKTDGELFKANERIGYAKKFCDKVLALADRDQSVAAAKQVAQNVKQALDGQLVL